MHSVIGAFEVFICRQHFAWLLDIFALDKFIRAVLNNLLNTFFSGFQMKLQANDFLTVNKRLVLTALALGDVDGSLRQIESVTVPVQHSELLGQKVE